MSQFEKSLRFAILGLSSGVIAAAFLGGWLWYSPIPFYDMWDGGFGFLLRSEGFPLSGWLDQHNEHRIGISRLLFWADYTLFGGRHVFLILFNYACVAVAWFVFWRCLRDLNSAAVEKQDLTLVGMVLGAWLFLWSQSDNFVLAFQSQFFLTQLLPLLAFLSLSRSAQTDEQKNLYFILAVFLGSASALTMASGVVALPLMAVWALVLRLPIWRAVVLASVSAVVMSLYFKDYFSPSHVTSPLEAFFSYPLDVLLFTFRYLASPFAHVISPLPPASYVIVALGLTLTIFAMLRTYQALKTPPRDSVSAGLLLFIIYIGATAFLTAGGRLFLSEYNVFTYRYTTPAIMAWAAAFCLASPWVFRQFYGSGTTKLRLLGFAALGVAALFVPVIRTIVPEKDFHFNQSLAVLALALGVDDPEQIAHVYPNSTPVLRTSDKAAEIDFGVFGRAPYLGLRESMGERLGEAKVTACTAVNLGSPIKLARATDFVRIPGTLSDFSPSVRESQLLILDENNTVVGAGLLNRPRCARDPSSGETVRTAKFVAYLKANTLGQSLTLASDACR